MHTTMKRAIRLCFGTALASAALYATAQPGNAPYPNRPIKIIVGVPPGGSTNNIARMLAQELQTSWGQATIVENRAGANTTIASEAVWRAPADGYTLLFATNAHVTIPLLTKLPYDPLKDFEPIGTLGVSRFVLSVHPSVPANTLQEFITYAKAHPGQLNFGSSGNGGTSHISGEVFNMLTGTRITHIPYKGAGPSLTDSIGGQVQVSYNTPMIVAPYAKTGKLKALAVTGPKRLSFMPDVPTFAEAGLPAFDEKAWYGLFAPAGTPKPVIDKLAAEVARIVASPAFKDNLEKQGTEPWISTPEQFRATMKTDMANLAKVISAANIKVD